MKTRKVLEVRWPTVIKCMRDVLGVSNNTNDYAEKDSAILKSEGGMFPSLKINAYKIENFSKRQGPFFNVFHAIHIINKHFILSVSFSKSQCNALSPACQFLFTHY